MRRMLCLTLLLTPMLATAQSAFERNYSVRVDVDAQGRVGQATAAGEVPEDLVPAIERAASRAEFEPATRAGTPMASTTTLNVKVRYEPVGRNYQAKVLAVTGNGGLVSPPPPVYPSGAVNQGYGARLVARLSFRADGSYDPDGSRIESVEVLRFNGKPHPERVAEFDQAFRDKLMDVLPKWRYSPDVVAGQGIAATVLVPVNFCPPQDRSICTSNRPAGAPADAALKVPVPLDGDLKLATLKPAAGTTAGT
jgi:hypothetical protein